MVVFLGRPLRRLIDKFGGSSGSRTAGLSLSTETVSLRLPTSTSKLFSPWRKTRKGPSYGGVNGGRCESLRINTNFAVGNEGISVELGAECRDIGTG